MCANPVTDARPPGGAVDRVAVGGRISVSQPLRRLPQVFVMLVAEYSTPKNSKNQVIVWDRIIMRDEPEKHVIAIKNGKPKYQFWDDGKHLKGTVVFLFPVYCICECILWCVCIYCPNRQECRA